VTSFWLKNCAYKTSRLQPDTQIEIEIYSFLNFDKQALENNPELKSKMKEIALSYLRTNEEITTIEINYSPEFNYINGIFEFKKVLINKKF